MSALVDAAVQRQAEALSGCPSWLEPIIRQDAVYGQNSRGGRYSDNLASSMRAWKNYGIRGLASPVAKAMAKAHGVSTVGLDGRSEPMLRYTAELHLSDHQRLSVDPT
jgi:hypothetical protein